MADMLQALYYTASTTAGITGITATSPDGSTEGVYMAGDVQQGATRPYLVIQQVGNEQTRDQSGDSALDRTYVQFTCVADTARAAYLLKEAVLTAFNNYRGAMGLAGSTVDVRRVMHENDLHLPGIPTDGSERAPQQWVLDMTIWHVTT